MPNSIGIRGELTLEYKPVIVHKCSVEWIELCWVLTLRQSTKPTDTACKISKLVRGSNIFPGGLWIRFVLE